MLKDQLRTISGKMGAIKSIFFLEFRNPEDDQYDKLSIIRLSGSIRGVYWLNNKQ
jgi:hypothetical protein